MKKKTPLTETDLAIGHIYRAKRPSKLNNGQYNDRIIRFIGEDKVQFDSPAVKTGQHYPYISKERFLKWAGADITGPRCRVCGCTEEYGCDEGCSWVEPDLCSSCAKHQEATA